MLCEINPLIVTPGRRGAGARLEVHGRRQRALPPSRHRRDARRRGLADPRSALAREKGVTYVKLDGEVGILGNGAGLSMSTVDVVVVAGGRPANFCDLGGGGDAQGVVDALEVITRDPQVRSIFFNIFGGITRCDEVARGILQALEQMKIELPIVVRLDGTNAEEGRRAPGRGRAAEPPRRADDARRRAARRGAGRMTDVWSRARRGLPREPDAPRRARPRPARRVVRAGRRRQGARRRDRRRTRRAAAARGGLQTSSPSIRARACRPTSSRARKNCRSRTAASTSSSRGSRRTTSRTSARPSPRWRASRSGSS